MGRYIVNDTSFNTVEDAVEYADKCASYSGDDIEIFDNLYGVTILKRKWWRSREGIELNDDPIDFGCEGYYGDWQDEML